MLNRAEERLSEARRQILRLLAERRISASDAELLLEAWREGYPEEADTGSAPGDVPPRGATPAGAEARLPSPRREAAPEPDRSERFTGGEPNWDRIAFDPEVEPTDAETEVDEAYLDLDPVEPPGDYVSQRESTVRSTVGVPGEEWEARPAESIPISEDGVLRIRSHDRDSQSKADPLTSIAVRGVATDRITIVRGVGVRVRRSGPEIQISWGVGLLLLEVPAHLGSLEFDAIPGSLGLSGYLGPFTVDGLNGPLTVHGPKSAFRVRNVHGLVRVLGLDLRDGISTIAQSDGDVEIEVADEASVSIRAVSTEGGVSLGETADEIGSASLRRRGVWRFGAGAAQLNVSTIRGRISLRRLSGTEKGPVA